MKRHPRSVLFALTLSICLPMLAAAAPDGGPAFVPLADGLVLRSGDRVEIVVRVDGAVRVEESLDLDMSERAPAKAPQGFGRAPASTVEILASAPAVLADLRAFEAADSAVEVEVRVQGARVASLALRDAASTVAVGAVLPARATSTVTVDGNPWIDPVAVLPKASECVELCETIFDGCMSGCGGNPQCQNACTWRRNNCVNNCNQCTPDTWGTVTRIPVSAQALPVPNRCYKDFWDPIATIHIYGHFVRKSTTTTYTRHTDCSVTSQVSVAYDELDCWEDQGSFQTCTFNVIPGPGISCANYFVPSNF